MKDSIQEILCQVYNNPESESAQKFFSTLQGAIKDATTPQDYTSNNRSHDTQVQNLVSAILRKDVDGFFHALTGGHYMREYLEQADIIADETSSKNKDIQDTEVFAVLLQGDYLTAEEAVPPSKFYTSIEAATDAAIKLAKEFCHSNECLLCTIGMTRWHLDSGFTLDGFTPLAEMNIEDSNCTVEIIEHPRCPSYTAKIDKTSKDGVSITDFIESKLKKSLPKKIWDFDRFPVDEDGCKIQN